MPGLLRIAHIAPTSKALLLSADDHGNQGHRPSDTCNGAATATRWLAGRGGLVIRRPGDFEPLAADPTTTAYPGYAPASAP